jgi:hypothetical protein
VRTNPRIAWTLAILVFLAAALTWWLSGDALARSALPYELLFQSEIPTEIPTTEPSPTFEPSPTLEPLTLTATLTATAWATSELPETVVPEPSATLEGPVEPTATAAALVPVPAPETPLITPEQPPVPTAPGYLPPPTLTSRDVTPTGQPQVAGSAPPAAVTPAPQPEPVSGSGESPSAVPGLGRLIDEGLVTLGYAWLCCGVFVLLGAALVLFWLARRGKRS